MTITPDDKDWTWVLERPCPDCGFDPATVVFADTAQRTRDEVARWVMMMHSRMNLAGRFEEGVWSRIEYAAHIRDVCRIMLARLNLMLVLDDPEFANWDQDATAVAADYGTQNPAVLAVEIEAAGEAIARAFELVPDSALGRTGRRSNGSTFTVETLAAYFLHDVIHHGHDVGFR